ncbi:FAD-dependent oxidoreductase [Candidatus Gracilibacteria bacterium]|nr:FAD-dependent oxidoreductase [Candidatus Gracilibacteria bacterium]
MAKKRVLILGAGFAGLRVAQDLQGQKGLKVTVVDSSRSHVYKADLYEVATAFNDEITKQCLIDLRETVATPFEDLLKDFVCDKVVKIFPEKNYVRLKKGGRIDYDFLVVALGSTTNFYGIKGLEKYSLQMKDANDALKINCHIDQYFQQLWKKGIVKDVVINVGGGGATGVETVAEMCGFVKKICKKYKYPVGRVKVQLIEGGNNLVNLHPAGTRLVAKRLRKLKVKVLTGHLIAGLEKDKVKCKFRGKVKTLPSDVFIWTGGVMVNSVVSASFGSRETRGAIMINEYLHSVKYPNVFAAGDNVYLENPYEKGRSLPMLASIAMREGKVLARNVLAVCRGEEFEAYNPGEPTWVVPIGGKYAIWWFKGRLYSGVWVWFLRRLIDFWYLVGILPFGKALAKWWRSNRVFVSND